MDFDTVTSADGTALVVFVRGPADAQPVVLCHGLGLTSASWGRVPALLEDGHRVIAYDLRGHGESARAAHGDYGLFAHARDLASVLAAKVRPGERPVVVGHSLGGGSSSPTRTASTTTGWPAWCSPARAARRSPFPVCRPRAARTGPRASCARPGSGCCASPPRCCAACGRSTRSPTRSSVASRSSRTRPPTRYARSASTSRSAVPRCWPRRPGRAARTTARNGRPSSPCPPSSCTASSIPRCRPTRCAASSSGSRRVARARCPTHASPHPPGGHRGARTRYGARRADGGRRRVGRRSPSGVGWVAGRAGSCRRERGACHLTA